MNRTNRNGYPAPKSQAYQQSRKTVNQSKRKNKNPQNQQRPLSVVTRSGNTLTVQRPLTLKTSTSAATTRRGQIIEEDEYIADIVGSTAFATTAYPVNPGQSNTFPWANKIASLYEKYDFERLEFYYRREVSEFATNGQAGKVMLSFDYDCTDNPPTSKVQVLDTDPHVDGMPCTEEIRLRINCDEARKQPSKFVRLFQGTTSSIPFGTDPKTYDIGTLYVSTFGCTNTTVVGELHVRYRCVLRVPVLETPLASYGSIFEITSNLSGEVYPTSTAYYAQFQAQYNPVIINNNLGVTIGPLGSITLPSGVFMIRTATRLSNSSTDITGSGAALEIARSASTGSGLVSGYTMATDTTVSPITGFFMSRSNPAVEVIWDTDLDGVTLGIQLKATFSTGSVLSHSYLKIIKIG